MLIWDINVYTCSHYSHTSVWLKVISLVSFCFRYTLEYIKGKDGYACVLCDKGKKIIPHVAKRLLIYTCIVRTMKGFIIRVWASNKEFTVNQLKCKPDEQLHIMKLINLLAPAVWGPNNASMHQQTKPASVQMLACRLIGGNAGILAIGSMEKGFCEIWIKLRQSSLKKMHLKMLSPRQVHYLQYMPWSMHAVLLRCVLLWSYHQSSVDDKKYTHIIQR